MTARELKIVMPGDMIKIKKGIMNSGCHATFIRILPADSAPPHGPNVDWIEYEFAGQREIAPHDRFTLRK